MCACCVCYDVYLSIIMNPYTGRYLSDRRIGVFILDDVLEFLQGAMSLHAQFCMETLGPFLQHEDQTLRQSALFGIGLIGEGTYIYIHAYYSS